MTSFKEIEKIVGRLIHLGNVLPSIHHFLSRLRELMRRAKNRRTISLNAIVIEDLKLMIFFLDEAKRGIDMNLLVYRKPTKVYRSDSCPAGLGGYSSNGYARRFYIPPELQFRASNNLLEHIGSIITPWVDVIEKRLGPGDCSLSMTDSSTSEGWARKTNFKEDGEEPIQATIRLEVARSEQRRNMEKKIRNYSQWFPGRHNTVSDALSRDDDRDDEKLTNILRTFAPSQMPSRFKIVPLPNKIVSWLTSLLRRLPVKERLREAHTRTKLGRGTDGVNTAKKSDSKKTSSSNTSPEATESDSWEPLPWLCAEDVFQDRLMIPWLRAQSEIPFHMWLRPSGRMTNQTQQKTKMASLESFYLANTGASGTATPPQSNKRPPPSASCQTSTRKGQRKHKEQRASSQ